MVERYEIRLSGSGGQGLILAGVILAEAATIYDSYYAVQSQAYGPEARGGSSKSEVILGTTPVSYPKAVHPDLLLALTQESFDKYMSSTREGGLIIVDSEFVENRQDSRFKVVALPITEIARTKVGREMVVNIVSLGIIHELLGMIKDEALEKAVCKRVPKGTEQLNLKALHSGIEAARNFKQEHGFTYVPAES